MPLLHSKVWRDCQVLIVRVPAVTGKQAPVVRRNSHLGGISPPAYVAMLVLGVVGETLSGTTDGRSWAVLTPIGLIAMGSCYLELRRKRASGAGFARTVLGPLNAVAGLHVGLAFVVLGLLVGLGVIESP